MSPGLAEVVDALTERLVTRVRTRDRLDALDEAATGPTYGDVVRGDPEALRAAVEDVLDDLAAALADRAVRARLVALCAGTAEDPDHRLARAGLAAASWTDGGVTATDAGRAVAGVIDGLVARVTDGARSRLAGPDDR